jgi:serine/threonine protein kinase
MRRIGGGGMGDIYLAQQPALNRMVAVKVIQGDGANVGGEEAKALAAQQFEQEARAVAALDHPNILPLYEYGEQGNIHYLVMPYIQEGSLADLLAHGAHQGWSVPLPYALTISIINQTASALQYAHDQGIVHRDVKPQNLLVRRLAAESAAPPEGAGAHSLTTAGPQLQILLSDFGLARFMHAVASRTGSTGTPLYSAPEQYDGYPVAATDQYALAGVAFLLLTGRAVFQGNVVELHHQHLTVIPPPATRFNAHLPPAVDVVLFRALAKDPAQRFARIHDFAQALQVALIPESQVSVAKWPHASPAIASAATQTPGAAQSAGIAATEAPASLGLYQVAQTPNLVGPSTTPTPGTTPLLTPRTRPTLPAAPSAVRQPDGAGAPLPHRARPFVRSRAGIVSAIIAVCLVVASLGAVALFGNKLFRGAVTTTAMPFGSPAAGDSRLRLATIQTQRDSVADPPLLSSLVPGAASLQTVVPARPRWPASQTQSIRSAANTLTSLPARRETAFNLAFGGYYFGPTAIPGLGQTNLAMPLPTNVSIATDGRYLVEALDGALHLRDLQQGTAQVVALADAFAPVIQGKDILGQSRVLFDPVQQRWLVVANEFVQRNGAIVGGYLDFGVSIDAKPTSPWYIHQISSQASSPGTCTWADDPQVGTDSVGFYISGNLFACGANGTFQGTALWLIPKYTFLQGKAGTIYVWTGFTNSLNLPAFGLSPAVETEPESVEMLLSNDAGYVDDGRTSNHITIWTVMDVSSGGDVAGSPRGFTPVLLDTTVTLPIGYADPPAALQMGSTLRVSTGDARMTNARFTGKHLYGAFTTAVNWIGAEATRSGVYWLDMVPRLTFAAGKALPSGVSVQVGQANIWGFARGYAFSPAMVADQDGNIVLAGSIASPTLYPSLGFSIHRSANQPNTWGRPFALVQSVSPITDQRTSAYASGCLSSLLVGGTQYVWVTTTFIVDAAGHWQTRVFVIDSRKG